VLVAVVLYAVAAPLEATLYGAPVLVALFVTAVRCAALVVALRAPLVGTLMFVLASVVVRLAPPPSGAPWPWTVTATIEFAALVLLVWARHGWRPGIIAFAVPGIGISALAQIHVDGRTIASYVVALSVGVIAAGIGALLRDRMRLGEALNEERRVSQAEQERRVVSEERQRIARELHDVVAHGLSLIQIQASSAPYRVPDAGPEAAAEFADIARAARGSLSEMRRLLGTLRGDDEAAERAPQPEVSDIPALVDDARRAGAAIFLTMPEGITAPHGVGIAAYRIVQEAISNAVRHAPRAAVDVVVDQLGGVLAIDVTNARAEQAATTTRPGHGLVGMRERAGLLGGPLEASPTPDGGFRVSARLPIPTGEGHDE
jgi:signal transduction histidine kinase